MISTSFPYIVLFLVLVILICTFINMLSFQKSSGSLRNMRNSTGSRKWRSDDLKVWEHSNNCVLRNHEMISRRYIYNFYRTIHLLFYVRNGPFFRVKCFYLRIIYQSLVYCIEFIFYQMQFNWLKIQCEFGIKIKSLKSSWQRKLHDKYKILKILEVWRRAINDPWICVWNAWMARK